MGNQQGEDPKITEGLQKASSAALEAAKMGKAAALIAKGAAAGGPGGATIAALKNPRITIKLAVVVGIIIILPVLLIAMLPLIIFNAIVGFVGGVLNSIGAFFRSLPIVGAIIMGIGSLFGGGTTAVNYSERIYFDNAFDIAHIVYNLERAHEIIGDAHYEQYQRVLARINEEMLHIPEGDEARIIGIEGDVFQFNTSVVLGLYAASLYGDVMQISLQDLREAMRDAERMRDLFNYIVEVEIEERFIYPDPPPPFAYVQNPETGAWDTPGWLFSNRLLTYVPENWIWSGHFNYATGIWQGSYVPPPPAEIEVTVHNFIIVYNGEMIFADIFGIADDTRLMTFAHEYARNLMSLLTDTDMGGWFGIVLEAGIVDGFYNPFPGMPWRISSPFGWRNNPFGTGGREFHNGIDIPKPIGTPIRAIADGYVILSQFSSGAGNWVQIDHGYIAGFGRVVSEYTHNSRNLVTVGQWVDAGRVIAEVGSTGRSTGPHLHLGIIVAGQHINPVIFINAPPS
ncbi:MAG: M23 family metallopeptidase [Defluviitaleaceae bacterium]|nr:M23 family metallopeptidase [Defluviitaleaceae bacterium]